MGIKEKFDDISAKYDEQRKKLIPCFDDFYNLPISAIDFKGDSPKVLDIGSGTGLFSLFLLKKYPNAIITLIDISDKMLDVAKERFEDYPNFEFIVGDYRSHEFNQSFDIIISALSIHHLTAKDKENLFRECHKLLTENGYFVNADQVLSPSNHFEELYASLWKKSVEESDFSQEEIDKAYERTVFDNPSTLDEQLKWLNESGFQEVDCIYKYFHFCVMLAKK